MWRCSEHPGLSISLVFINQLEFHACLTGYQQISRWETKNSLLVSQLNSTTVHPPAESFSKSNFLTIRWPLKCFWTAAFTWPVPWPWTTNNTELFGHSWILFSNSCIACSSLMPLKSAVFSSIWTLRSCTDEELASAWQFKCWWSHAIVQQTKAWKG